MFAASTARLTDQGLVDATLQIMGAVGGGRDYSPVLKALEERALALADAGVTSGIVEAEIRGVGGRGGLGSLRMRWSSPAMVRLSLSAFQFTEKAVRKAA